jgi:Na+-transporting methylmalonyl-CoA/oxaloacetate decarboxylase gamma subunit
MADKVLSLPESLMDAGFCMLVVFALLVALWAAISFISLVLRRLARKENSR